jgi:hypothetical protein
VLAAEQGDAAAVEAALDEARSAGVRAADLEFLRQVAEERAPGLLETLGEESDAGAR